MQSDYYVNVHILPVMVSPKDLEGDTVVVIDVLRATTTMAHALAAGAKQVIPCLEIDDAWAEAERHDRADIVLGGERKGVLIDGFDLGNTPTEYAPETVGGKTVIFTTTNGTRALHHAADADDILLAGFVNAHKITEQLMDKQRIHFLCAGTDGRYSVDDVLVAGCLVERINRMSGLQYTYNAQAIAAMETWQSAFAVPYVIGAEPLPPEMLAAPLRESLGGKNLVEIGLDRDIVDACRIDTLDVVPRFYPEEGRVRAS